MDFKQFKKRSAIIIYGIFGFIVAIIFIRILLKALGANPDANFVVFWYDLSYFFVGIFDGIYPNIAPESSNLVIELYSIVAMLFYMLLSFLTSKSISSVADSSALRVIQNIVDALFKFAEFLLITRFIFKITSASTASTFVEFIYSVSALVYEPFRNIFPTIKVENFNIVFETSTLLAIIVIIIFDIITEGIIEKLMDTDDPKEQSNNNNNGFAMAAHAPQQQQPQAQPANITINIPQPQAQPAQQPIIDNRTVQVYPSGNYPGQGQNHLEGQRPAPDLQLPGNNAQTPVFGQNASRNPNQGA